MRDCDIKFVNKEITPFAVFPCSSGCSKNAGWPNILNKVAFRPKVSTGVTSLFSSYWDCLQVYGVAQVVSDILKWCVMTPHYAICSVGNVEPTIGLTSIISANSHRPSVSVCSDNYSDGSSLNCCLTITHWTLIPP